MSDAYEAWKNYETPADATLSRGAEELLYKLARHIRNTDKMPAVEWGLAGCDLLAQLREIDPQKYDRLVK